MNLLKRFTAILVSIFFSFLLISPVLAEDSNQIIQDLQNKINEYESLINEAQGKQKTLSSAISIINNQIYLTVARIEKTENEIQVLEDEIEDLSKKILLLDKNLDETVAVLNARIEETYKQSFLPSFYLFVSSIKFSDLFSQIKYLRTAQAHDREVLFEMEQMKQNFDKQKALKEEKQASLEELEVYLENQQIILDQQKISKQDLLMITKNDESRYQQLKKDAERELSSLLAAKFVGKREVKKGDALGIMGSTGFSTGPHLHFGLYELQENDLNNWNYYADFDAQSYLSQHRWPFNGEIRITQERGVTSFSSVYADGFHHGLDMYSSNKTIVTINDGVAYFYRNPKDSLGNHAKVFHPDGKMTLYAHME